MAFDWDRWNKRLWFVNGLFVLPIVVIGAVLMVLGVGESHWFGDAEPDVPARDTTEAADVVTPRAVRYSPPAEVRDGRARLVLVRFGRGYEPIGPGLGSEYARSYSDRDRGPIVNVIFIDPDGTGRLLLDRPAFVQNVNYPDRESDSLLTWISYEIAFTDTDRDGRLDEDDDTELHVSDLDGRGLRRILPTGWKVVGHEALARGRLLVLALEPAPEGRQLPDDQRRQRAFAYDVRAGSLAPQAGLDSLADRAGRIVGRK